MLYGINISLFICVPPHMVYEVKNKNNFLMNSFVDFKNIYNLKKNKSINQFKYNWNKLDWRIWF